MSRRERGQGVLAKRLPRVMIAVALMAALFTILPIVTATHAYFTDWANHLWLIAKQADIMRQQGGLPGLFMDTPQTGLLYPQFLFYGGTLYGGVGYLALLTGSPTVAYALSWLGATGAAYGGIYWAGRMVGLPRAWAQVPPLTYITSAYFLTNAYARGAWTELVATSFLILAVACAMRHFTARPVPITARLGLALSVAMVVGSHVLTTVWGTTMVIIVLAITSQWWWRRALERRNRAWSASAAIAIGAAIPAWQYIPALPWMRSTNIAEQLDSFIARDLAAPVQDLTVLLSPWRWVPDGLGTPHFYVQIPIVVLVLSIVACLLWLPQRRTPVVGLSVLVGLLIAIATGGPLWGVLPGPWHAAQFPYRVLTYITLITCLLVIAGLRQLLSAPPRQATWRRGALLAGIVGATAFSVGSGLVQGWTAPTFSPVSSIVADTTNVPATFYADKDYRIRGATPVRSGGRIPAQQLTPSAVALPVGPSKFDSRVSTIVWSPGLAATNGANVPGPSRRGLAVLSSQVSAGEQPIIRAGSSTAYTVGSVITLLALMLTGAGVGWAALRWSQSARTGA